MNQKERIQHYLQRLSGLDFAQRYYQFYERSPRGDYATFGTRARVEAALGKAGLGDLKYDSREKGLRYCEERGEVEFWLETYFRECTLHYFLTVKTSDWRIRAGCEILAWEVAKLDDPDFEPDPMYPKLWFNDAASLQAVAEFGVTLFRDVRDAVLDSELVDGLDTDAGEAGGDQGEFPANSSTPVEIGDEVPSCRLYRLDPGDAQAARSDRETLKSALNSAAPPLDLGAAWGGLHVVLTDEPPVPKPKALELGLSWLGEPLEEALMGGDSTPLSGSYGPYRLLDTDKVKEVAQALDDVSVAEFESLYEAEELEELQISHGHWHEPAQRLWLVIHFEQLRSWYVETGQQNRAVLIAID